MRLDLGLVRDSALVPPLISKRVLKLTYSLFVPRERLPKRQPPEWHSVVESVPLALQTSGGQFHRTLEEAAKALKVRLAPALCCISFTQAAPAVISGRYASILPARPDTKVVFSTSWRLGFPFFVLGWLWHHHELPLNAVVGRTPVIAEDQRGQEVKKWLQDAPTLHLGCEIRRYAALDDEIEPLMGWLPRKMLFRCDPYHGLTTDTTNRLIRHFST